jgi:hypothetical protein
MEVKMISHNSTKKYVKNNKSKEANANLSAMQSPLYFVFIFTLAVVPLFIHSQWITGVLVNFILILSCFKYKIKATLPLAFIPSIAAVSGGLIPLPLTTFIPFIIVANIILVLIIHFIKAKYVISVSVAAFVKFAFLYWAANFLAPNFLPELFVNKVILIMGWHQLATAMVGGMLAVSLMKGLTYTDRQ